jgi:hypothetical protein
MPNTPQRTFASGVTFQLGLLSASFDVAPVKAPRSKRVTVCSECTELTRLSQVMVCTRDPEHQFDLASATRAMEIDGVLRPLSEDDLLDLREDDIETGVLNLSVCPTAELDEATRSSDSGYRVRLNKKARGSEQYACSWPWPATPSCVAPFDEELLVDSRKAKLDAIIASKALVTPVVRAKAAKGEPSMLALLTKAVEKKSKAA